MTGGVVTSGATSLVGHVVVLGDDDAVTACCSVRSPASTGVIHATRGTCSPSHGGVSCSIGGVSPMPGSPKSGPAVTSVLSDVVEFSALIEMATISDSAGPVTVGSVSVTLSPEAEC